MTFETEGGMTTTQSEVGLLFDHRSEAIWAKDIERLMSLYSPEIVYFDLVPPLQYVGADALRERFLEWFDGFEGPIRQEISELNVVESGDVAIAHMLIRAGGARKDGQEVSFWVRVTDGCRRSNGEWLITHEHVSLPVDLMTRSAAMDLVP
jgi:ketosteroid isomerase-like protein